MASDFLGFCVKIEYAYTQNYDVGSLEMKILEKKLEKLFGIKQHRAFTLSEVLITLGIIGVIAALTIPLLMSKTQDQEFKSMLKENLSILNSALILYRDEQGDNFGYLDEGYTPYIYGCTLNNSAQFPQIKLGRYLPVAKYCSPWILNNYSCVQDKSWGQYTQYNSEAGCWSDPLKIKFLNGHYPKETILGETFPGWANMQYDGGILLKNGACVIVQTADVVIDLNCKTGPNTIGRDIHVIFLSRRADGSSLFSPTPDAASGTTQASQYKTLYNDTNGYGACSTNPANSSDPSKNSGFGCADKWLRGEN